MTRADALRRGDPTPAASRSGYRSLPPQLAGCVTPTWPTFFICGNGEFRSAGMPGGLRPEFLHLLRKDGNLRALCIVLVGQAVSPANLLPMPEYRRRLPHFHPDDAYLFLTWRLWGSLPSKPPSRPYPTPGHAFVAADRCLHRDYSGPLWHKQPRIARLVVEAMVAGERERGFYELSAWVVMPNHVHLLILPKVAVPEITRWLKGSTARRANQLLGRTGLPFWQDESYDHWVRNTKEFDRIIGYVEENPVSAGLVGSMELWPWSSAAWQAKAPAPPSLKM